VKLVTGGSGFVGGHIVERLLERGEEVRVFDKCPPEVGRDRVEFVRGDIRNKRDVRGAMESVDVVFHTVALVPVTDAGRKFYDVNVGGTRNVVEAAANAGVDRLVHLGSSSVYALDNLPLTEKSDLRPKGAYSESKLESDRVVLRSNELDATVIRPRTVVDKRRSGIFHILFDWISRGKRVYLVGSGGNQFQMVSGRDTADAAIAASETDVAVGEVYNVGADEFGTMREAYTDLISYAGTGASVTGLPRVPTKFGMWALDALDLSPLTTFHYKTIDEDFYFDISKAKRDLDWVPSDSNKSCMRRGYDWYVNSADDGGAATGEGHRKAPDQGLLKLLRRFS
jgi:nucleoside-diphosphate-sugar epimerase